MKILVLLSLIVAVIGTASGRLFVDTASPLSFPDFSYGAVDGNATKTIANAWLGGMNDVSVYMFPCFKCGNPAQQVTDAVENLRGGEVRYSMFWLDIEGEGLYWSSNMTANQVFFEGLVAQAKALKQDLGVYSSVHEWGTIMGLSYTFGGDLPLWYAHYQTPADPSFADFTPFAGWKKPFAKQYADHGPCGVDVDMSWAP